MSQNFAKNFEVFLIGVGVHQEVINVHQPIVDVMKYSFQESLKACRAPQQAHGQYDPMELSLCLNLNHFFLLCLN